MVKIVLGMKGAVILLYKCHSKRFSPCKFVGSSVGYTGRNAFRCVKLRVYLLPVQFVGENCFFRVFFLCTWMVLGLTISTVCVIQMPN
jgi:hypothetical protein